MFDHSAFTPAAKVATLGQFKFDVIWFHVRCLACMVGCYTLLLLIQGGVLRIFPPPPALSSLFFTHVTQKMAFHTTTRHGTASHQKDRGNKTAAKRSLAPRFRSSTSTKPSISLKWSRQTEWQLEKHSQRLIKVKGGKCHRRLTVCSLDVRGGSRWFRFALGGSAIHWNHILSREH